MTAGAALHANSEPVATEPAIEHAPRPRLLTVDDALRRLLTDVRTVAGTETVPTFDARGRVLAEPLTSRIDVPASDNAQMDGYAVRVVELAAASDASPVALPVSQRVPAGQRPAPLEPGSAARIFTGAPMPDGADAVVMQELAEVDAAVDAAAGRVRFARPAALGEWVRRRGCPRRVDRHGRDARRPPSARPAALGAGGRRRGEDIRAGQTILAPGTRLGPQHLGLAASIGTAGMRVVRRPRVAIFSTGDELAMPGAVAAEDLPPGSLFNSNRFTMRGLVEALGCEVVDLGIVPDTLAATREAVVRAARGSDCIVTSGGVSVGEEDHIRPAVAAEGRLDFWQIAIKPGKPLAFGRVGDAWFVGLPGNPVSGFVTFLVFVRPLLMRLHGLVDVAPKAYTLRADFDWPRPDRRQEYLRVRGNDAGGLDLFPEQGSAVMTSTVWADGLVENPPGTRIAVGDLVRFLPFSALIG